MMVKQVTYGRLVNMGNYEHEKFELTIELEEGETVSQAVTRARNFISAKMIKAQVSQYQYEVALRTVADPLNHTGSQVKEAEGTIHQYNSQNDELPF